MMVRNVIISVRKNFLSSSLCKLLYSLVPKDLGHMFVYCCQNYERCSGNVTAQFYLFLSAEVLGPVVVSDGSFCSLFHADPFLACPVFAVFLCTLFHSLVQCYTTESKHRSKMPQKFRFLEMIPKNFPRISML